MERGVRRGSKTLELIAIIQNVTGETFAEKCANYAKVLDARLSSVGSGEPQWHELVRLKGFVESFIRLDSQPVVLEKEPSESALAAVA